MAPEHKFATAAKLCGEVLGGVADGLLPLEQCEEVLGDALRCLASKDIKVNTFLTHVYMILSPLATPLPFLHSLPPSLPPTGPGLPLRASLLLVPPGLTPPLLMPHVPIPFS